MESLESRDTRNLLDVVDRLRFQGINKYIDLPQIIVCGEQSCGKSSVLEAVSGLKFPSKDNICTCFATELILRRGKAAPVKVSIIPGLQEQHTEVDLHELEKFSKSIPMDDLKLDEVVESAKNAMGIKGAKVFSSDTLRLELSGLDQPNLTLVDLPGLFEAGSRSQSDADAETVKSLVLSYMQLPRSVIIAVVSARNEFNNQAITKYSRQIDPNGTRTLGLITKPDELPKGSDSEGFFIELAQNADVKLNLGWHVLRNRGYEDRNSSREERDKAENDFFKNSVWNTLPPGQLGVKSLRPRLSEILKSHIIAQLPDVLTQIKNGIQKCTNNLNKLGASRTNSQQQRQYLGKAGQSFHSLITAAIDGQYSDSFFEDCNLTRIRAIVQNTMMSFAAIMSKEGHVYSIVDDNIELSEEYAHIRRKRSEKIKRLDGKPLQISRTKYLSKVEKILERSRGRGLPGTFDPIITGELFREQCRPWRNLVNETVETIFDAVKLMARMALAHSTDASTSDRLWKRLISVRLENMAKKLRQKVEELLEPYYHGHPITYNHYLIDTVQKVQSTRQANKIKKKIVHHLESNGLINKAPEYHVGFEELTNCLTADIQVDMDNYASSTATDFMEAYYKVALKNFIDSVAVLAVEACLISKLPTLFSANDVIALDDADVGALASESEETIACRIHTEEKLAVLKDGLRELKAVQMTQKVTASFQDSTLGRDTDLSLNFQNTAPRDVRTNLKNQHETHSATEADYVSQESPLSSVRPNHDSHKVMAA